MASRRGGGVDGTKNLRSREYNQSELSGSWNHFATVPTYPVIDPPRRSSMARRRTTYPASSTEICTVQIRLLRATRTCSVPGCHREQWLGGRTSFPYKGTMSTRTYCSDRWIFFERLIWIPSASVTSPSAIPIYGSLWVPPAYDHVILSAQWTALSQRFSTDRSV
jgi:hypothetical protein